MPFWRRHHPVAPTVDEMTAKASLPPYESALYGSTKATRGKQYGYGWFSRTFGLGAIRIEWTAGTGLQSIAVWARACANSKYFSDIFVATKNTHWIHLLDDEYVTAIDVGVAKNRVSSVRFKTNLRQSQWFGSTAKTVVHHLAPPPGFIIHTIHSECAYGQCKNLGAYFVPVSLFSDPPNGSTFVENSAVIGSKAYDSNSRVGFQFSKDTVGAIVVSVKLQLTRVRLLTRTDYSRHLAHFEKPLNDGDCLLVLVEHEFLTGLRAWVRGKDQLIAAVQFVTNRRTTEWFGSVPPADSAVEARCVEDEPRATHIGGIFGMLGDGGIKSIAVRFYHR